MAMTRRDAIRAVGVGAATTALAPLRAIGQADARERPNVLWISCEDISPHLGCYGDPHARTPNLDRLASEGTRYTHAFTVHGVCAPSRSGIITGMYPSSIGTTYMRCGAKLPEHIRCFPEYLREAGYYCTNNAKTDYQFAAGKATWDDSSKKAHWRERADGQPFFSVVNFTMTHESQYRTRGEEYAKKIARLSPEDRQDPDSLTTLPPYYADTPETREDWAHYYELITVMDARVGDVLAELEEDGLADSTIVVFWSDHGAGLPRAKRWLYDSGTRVPLIVRIPEALRTGDRGAPGSVDDRLINMIDLGPTVMNLAGVDIPDHMHGRPFLGAALPRRRKYIFGARDRVDERYDMIRSVRDRRYRYVHNFEPWRPHLQWVEYAERTPTRKELRRLLAEGALQPEAAQFLQDGKPVEELYDLNADPHEVDNLADSPKHQGALKRLRRQLDAWMAQSRDVGLIPEPELVEMERQVGSRYEILRQPGAMATHQRRRAAVRAGESGDLPALLELLADEDASVRFWAAMWLGTHDPVGALGELRERLDDGSAVVRIAAARGVCLAGDESGVGVLEAELRDGGNEYARLRAATELDYLGEAARPALDTIRAASTDDKSNYVKRLAERIVRKLESG